MANIVVFVFIASLGIRDVCSNSEEDLMNHLLNFTYYDKRVRPVLEDHRPVVVKHGVFLTELSDIDEKQQKMIVNVLQKIEWKDELLNWDPGDYGELKNITVNLKKFWAPRLLLYNNADDNYPINRDVEKGTKVILTYDGNITWILQGILKSSCKIDIQYFPMDEQFCSLRIGSWTYGIDKLDIYPTTDNVDLSLYNSNGEWELVETYAQRHTLEHICCRTEVAEIEYHFHIRRLPLFYTTNFILPCALIAVLTALVFLTPAETGEQLAVGVTILLALVVFFLMVETKVPNTSDHLPLIAKYYCCTVVEISAVLAVTCIIHKFEHHSAEPVPNWVKKYIIGYIGKIVFMKFDKKTGRGSAQEKKDPNKEHLWLKRGATIENILLMKKRNSIFDNNKHLELISGSIKDNTESENFEMEWKHAANVLARFMTIVYILAITITFFAVIFVHEHTDNVFPNKS